MRRSGAEHELVVTNGNGPQVGLLALQAEAYREGGVYPLDVLGAESEEMIGYMLQHGLRNALPGRAVATVLTQVVVNSDDPACGSRLLRGEAGTRVCARPVMRQPS